MKFSEENQAYVVINKLSHQRQAGQFCDVVVVVRGHKVKAHRNVLAANSKYFYSIFKKKRMIKEKVNLEFCSNVNVLLSLLNYMYTGIIVIDPFDIEELMELTHQFGMDKVMGFCEVYLREHLNMDNCFVAHRLATKYEISELIKETLEFIIQNLVEVLEKDEILHLTIDELKKLFNEVKGIMPQRELLNLLCKWIRQDEGNRQDYFSDLLSFVNCEGMDSEWIEGNILFKTNPKCLHSFLSSLEKNTIKFLGYEEKFELLKNELDTEENCSVLSDNIYSDTKDESDEEIMETDANHKDLQNECNDSTNNSKLVQTKRSRKSAHPQRVVSPPTRHPRAAKRLGRKRSQQPVKTKSAPKGRKMKTKTPVSDDSGDSDSSNEAPVKTTRKPKCDRKLMETLKCDQCSFFTLSSKRLANHIFRDHSINATYKCSFCDFISKQHPEHILHLKTHYITPPFKCTDCEYSTDKIYTISSHLFSHSQDRPFSCDQCDYKCITASVLKQHITIQHTGEKPFECVTCGRKFAAKYLLKQHSFTHTEEKPFLCDHCGYSAKQKKLLSNHMQIHKGKLIKCTYDDCPFTTTSKSHLSRHRRVHSGIKSHVCTYCGKSFFHRNDLTRHEKLHLNVTPFACEHCDFASSRKEKLKEHLRRYHHAGASSKGSFRTRKKRLLRINDDDDSHNSRRPLCSQTTSNPNNHTTPEARNVSDEDTDPLNSSIPPQVYFNYLPMAVQQANAMQQFQTTYDAVSNVPHTVIPNQVPAMSHEMPTTFKSYMSFL